MAAPSSGYITKGDLCDEAAVHKDGVLYPTSSRASARRFQDDVSCDSKADPLYLASYYGYVHPIVEIISDSFVGQTFTRYTFNIRVDVTTDYVNRDRPLVLRLRQTYNAGATSFSVIAGDANKPDLVDPDSVVFDFGSFPNAESVVFSIPAGTTTKTFTVTVPKIGSPYDVSFDLIRTKGVLTDDKYKIVNNVNVNPLGGPSGIDRYDVTVPAAPLLYSWESTDEGGLNNDCNVISLPDNCYLFKDGNPVGAGVPVVGDEVYSNSDLNNLIPFALGNYIIERNGNRYQMTIFGTPGIINSITACP